MTWNKTLDELTLPDLHRQPQAAVRALQDRLVRAQVEICHRNHPYYRKLMRQAGVEPRHIQNTDDLVRLPVTAKSDFLADPEAFRLEGDGLPPELTTLWKVLYTTGTTSGRPAPVYVTTFDYYAFLHGNSRPTEGLVDLNTTDTIANVFPLNHFPMGAFSRATDEAYAVGAAVVQAHTGRPGSPFPVHHGVDYAVRLVEQHKATILWGVAGFVRRVLVRAEETGADFRTVRRCMITGEATSVAMRDDMRDRMRRLGCRGAEVTNRYGSTEQGTSMIECREGSGFHNMLPDQVFHEICEPETGRRLAEGESGMLAFTHLLRSGTVFLRYAIGDVASLTTATCPHCGRTSPRLVSTPVRTGDIIKIKGTLVNLQALKERLERMPSIVEYQIVVRPLDENDAFSMDELVVRLALSPGAAPTVGDDVVAETAAVAHVRPRIEMVERDAIFDPTQATKPRRVVDLRPPKG